MNNLEELLNGICGEIRKRNTERNMWAIPQSEEFFNDITKKYNLIPFAIPKLIKILVDSHKIFQFVVVEADRKEKIRRTDGYVVTEGNILKTLLEYYSDELVRAYSHEFSKKLGIDKIIKEFVPNMTAFNNTVVGKTANIVINLISLQSVLERNIMLYGHKWQEKQLALEIEQSDPLSAFIENEVAAARGEGIKEPAPNGSAKRRATDAEQFEEFKKNSSKYPLEKTLAVYGVEFYTRVCFREYQFELVQKLVDDKIINDKDDLLTIKKLLQRERANSDKDLNLQKFAAHINNLEKSINAMIKQVQ